ncbi:hypothetical protein JCM3770_000037, partial [Rhodotorula araucariae]
VYHHSITGFVRLIIGLLILDSPQNEELVVDALASAPAALAPVLDALDELARLHDEQRQARNALALPTSRERSRDGQGDDERGYAGCDSQRTELAGGQAEDTEMDAVGADTELPARMRELVQRLRRRVP